MKSRTLQKQDRKFLTQQNKFTRLSTDPKRWPLENAS